MPETPDPLVTLVVTPREKWSIARQSLDSILEHTAAPHRMVYVDGGSPGPVRRHVAARARGRAGAASRWSAPRATSRRTRRG